MRKRYSLTGNSRKNPPLQRWRKSFRHNYDLYLLLIPVMAYFLLFKYVPMYGVQIAFRDFFPISGIGGSPWVGFKHFERFFSGFYIGRVLRNTFGISIYTILVGIPAPVILAIMFNELRFRRFKTVAQTLSYAPNFLSVVVVVGIVFFFFSPSRGVINALRVRFGAEAVNYISNPRFFWHLYVWSGVWQTVGWSSIIYVASMSGIPEEQYEAAFMDGATKLQRIRYITIPGILPTIVIISILSFGRVLEVGFEKVYLLQTPLNLEASEVIRTYVYKSGIQGAQFSFAAAVDLFNNAVNFVILVIVNQVARSVGETSLW